MPITITDVVKRDPWAGKGWQHLHDQTIESLPEGAVLIRCQTATSLDLVEGAIKCKGLNATPHLVLHPYDNLEHCVRIFVLHPLHTSAPWLLEAMEAGAKVSSTEAYQHGADLGGYLRYSREAVPSGSGTIASISNQPRGHPLPGGIFNLLWEDTPSFG